MQTNVLKFWYEIVFFLSKYSQESRSILQDASRFLGLV